MKLVDGFKGLGPYLIFSAESAEQAPFGDDIENCLSVRCPRARRLLKLWGRLRLGR